MEWDPVDHSSCCLKEGGNECIVGIVSVNPNHTYIDPSHTSSTSYVLTKTPELLDINQVIERQFDCTQQERNEFDCDGAG